MSNLCCVPAPVEILPVIVGLQVRVIFNKRPYPGSIVVKGIWYRWLRKHRISLAMITTMRGTVMHNGNPGGPGRRGGESVIK